MSHLGTAPRINMFTWNHNNVQSTSWQYFITNECIFGCLQKEVLTKSNDNENQLRNTEVGHYCYEEWRGMTQVHELLSQFASRGC